MGNSTTTVVERERTPNVIHSDAIFRSRQKHMREKLYMFNSVGGVDTIIGELEEGFSDTVLLTELKRRLREGIVHLTSGNVVENLMMEVRDLEETAEEYLRRGHIFRLFYSLAIGVCTIEVYNAVVQALETGVCYVIACVGADKAMNENQKYENIRALWDIQFYMQRFLHIVSHPNEYSNTSEALS